MLTLTTVTGAYASDEPATPDRDLTGFETVDQAQPLWEFGAAGGAAEVPNYPSSSERNFFALVAPYVIYRGDTFRIGDGRGVRAVVVEDQDLKIDLSFGGAFAADSEDNTVREGMPELDFLFEVGPQLVYRVKDFAFNSGGKARLNFRLQTRAVFSTDLERLDHRGFVFEPRLTYQQRGRLHPDTGLNISISATFGTERLNDYFYEVSSEFVTANRAQFDASSGYIGTELSVGFSFPVTKNIRGFVGADMQLLHGAENRNSPLFEDKITFGVAAGFVWRMYQSKRRANW